jgi:urease accessory protein
VKPFDLAGAATPAGAGLQASIEFARDASGRTFVSRQRVGYPFHLGRALRSPGDPAGMPTLYLQSCAGGMFDGDDLRLRIVAGEQASAHVTTGAATIVHSTDSLPACQVTELEADPGAYLEYLPDPSILFPRARLDSQVRVRLHPQATVIVGDSILLHDPRGGDGVFGWLKSETRIEDPEGRLLVCDRFQVEGGAMAKGLPGVTGVYAAQGSLFVATQAASAAALVDAMRAVLVQSGVHAGAGLLPNRTGAWARILAEDAAGLKAAMFAAWAAARELLTGSPPIQRRK